MKRKVFLFGGSGGRMLEALLFMAFAGITPEETLDLVLCDPDGDGMHGAVQLRQELADYQRIWASRTYIIPPSRPKSTSALGATRCP